MGTERPVRQLLARLDSDLSRALAGRDHVVLAFSGGLGSLILAASARKHGDVHCVVVGMPRAADVDAALLAKDFLDYPVEVVSPDPEGILRVARSIHAAAPRLAPADVLSLVPLALVRERHADEPVLSGFGLVPRSAALHRHLVAANQRPPALRAGSASSPSRAVALRVAGELGLPAAFSHAARRTAAEGSGIGPVLRALGHARHASAARLLDAVV